MISIFHSSQRPLRKRPESVTLGLEETNFIVALFSSASSLTSPSVSQHGLGGKGRYGGLVMPNKVVQLLDTCSYYLRTPKCCWTRKSGNFCDDESVYKLEIRQQSPCCATLDKIFSSAHSVNLPFELDPCSFPLCFNRISLKKAIKDSGLLEFRLCFWEQTVFWDNLQAPGLGVRAPWDRQCSSWLGNGLDCPVGFSHCVFKVFPMRVVPLDPYVFAYL